MFSKRSLVNWTLVDKKNVFISSSLDSCFILISNNVGQNWSALPVYSQQPSAYLSEDSYANEEMSSKQLFFCYANTYLQIALVYPYGNFYDHITNVCKCEIIPLMQYFNEQKMDEEGNVQSVFIRPKLFFFLVFHDTWTTRLKKHFKYWSFLALMQKWYLSLLPNSPMVYGISRK